MKLSLNCLLIGSLALASARADQHFESGVAKTSLVELYTSEGCSSCPPAERWLAQFRTDPQLWKAIVPVEFHVTYWDNLGWPDRFAKKSFTEREYNYAHLWRSEGVYTPCFVKDGIEWKPSPLSSGEEAGKLSATIDPERHVRVTFEPKSTPSTTLEVWVAVLVSDVVSDVKRGENAGRSLSHDFTAIQLVNTKLVPIQNSGVYSASILFPAEQESSSGRKALAVWVTAEEGVPVLQATGGWLQSVD